MLLRQEKIRHLALCLILSVTVHSAALCAVRMFGSYRFGAAVGEVPVMVSLNDLREGGAEAPKPPAVKDAEALKEWIAEKKAPSLAPPVALSREEAPAAQSVAATPAAVADSAAKAAAPSAEEPPAAERAEMPEPVERKVAPVEEKTAAAPEEKPALAQAAVAADIPKAAPAAPSPVSEAERKGSSTGASQRKWNYLFAKEEKLTYLISMRGLPIGSAELEVRNNERGTTLTLRVRSNAAISSMYPVDNLVETQQVDGRYLMTNIRQHEGSFKSDETFSINLQQKRVTLTDNIRYRNLKMTVPTEDVLDTLSGIYSLRNRPLQVGKTETLHIFDSEKYADVPVEILRREEMRLPNLTKVDALVVRPMQKTAGIFRRTGDILIWMTDDADKVPVKIVTTISLGKVTAELVSAQSQPHDTAANAKAE